MNSKEFRQFGYQMIDFVADLKEKLSYRDPTPNVKPGFMQELIPKAPPENPEPFAKIMADIEPVILKGVPYWQHQHYHGYQPSGNGWPSILGNILCNSIGCNAGSWSSGPAATELEIIVLDWMAKFFDLPPHFLSSFSNPESKGGGCIYGSGTETILVSLLAAREHTLIMKRSEYPNVLKAELKGHLIAYCSQESHSSFAKACNIAGVKFRALPTNERGEVTKTTLKMAIRDDKLKGLIPFFFNAILGSTSVCSFDDLIQIGALCHDQHIWLHGDAGYAGCAFCCDEMRYMRQGLQYLTSLTIHPNEGLDVNFDCALYWVKDKSHVTDVFSGFDPNLHNLPIVDYRHWGISALRRFRALKLWFTLRLYGKEKLRDRVRKSICMARSFDTWVRRDRRFEPVGITRFGMTAFRLIGNSPKIDAINAALVEALNSTHKIFLTPAVYKGKYVIRFMVCSDKTNEQDVDIAWQWVSDMAEILVKLREMQGNPDQETLTLIEETEKWKRTCKRKLNFELVNHLRKYVSEKAKGNKDIIAESTAHILETTIGDLLKMDEMNAMVKQGHGWKENDFVSLASLSGRPRILLTDSAGNQHSVAGNFFRDSDFQDLPGDPFSREFQGVF